MMFEPDLRPSVPVSRARRVRVGDPVEFNARVTLQDQTMHAICLEADCEFHVMHSVESPKIGAAKGRELIREHRLLKHKGTREFPTRAVIDLVVVLPAPKEPHA